MIWTRVLAFQVIFLVSSACAIAEQAAGGFVVPGYGPAAERVSADSRRSETPTGPLLSGVKTRSSSADDFDGHMLLEPEKDWGRFLDSVLIHGRPAPLLWPSVSQKPWLLYSRWHPQRLYLLHQSFLC